MLDLDNTFGFIVSGLVHRCNRKESRSVLIGKELGKAFIPVTEDQTVVLAVFKIVIPWLIIHMIQGI